MSNTLLQPSLDIAGVRQRALLWWSNPTLEACVQKEILTHRHFGEKRNYSTLTGREIEIIYNAENSLFKKPCYTKKCVYNVSSVCKCSSVGSVCQSHVA